MIVSPTAAVGGPIWRIPSEGAVQVTNTLPSRTISRSPHESAGRKTWTRTWFVPGEGSFWTISTLAWPASLVGSLDRGRARRGKDGRRTAGSFIPHDPARARAVIALPPDGRGQRLLRAGGDDGRGGEAKLGIDPIDRRRLGTFGGKDHVGSDDRHVADAFDRRTDRDPALSAGDMNAVARPAGPLGHAGRAADGRRGGDQAGTGEITDQVNR